jgi:hypothetical protein
MKLRPLALRSIVLYGFVAVSAALFATASLRLLAADNEITVYKTPTCGCCGKWVDHLKANGFKVTVHDVESTDEYSSKAGVPESARSCHVGLVAGYAVEGHVPAADIQRLLKERPKAKGLAVPGMPVGSPGMDFPGGAPGRYNVVLIGEDGKTSTYQQYPRK